MKKLIIEEIDDCNGRCPHHKFSNFVFTCRKCGKSIKHWYTADGRSKGFPDFCPLQTITADPEA